MKKFCNFSEISLRGCLKSQGIESLRAERSNLCLKKRLLRRLRLLAMTGSYHCSDNL
jgi:hypothetical protein